MDSGFFKNKKNLAILGAVCLICIAFVVSSLKRDTSVTEETGTSAQTGETAAMAETEAESEAVTPPEPERRVFSRPASSLKEIAGEDTEEYVPAPFRLNLAYFYPEDADISDAIHSYAGQIFQTLNTLNADYLANYYDMSDMTPLSFANRQGQGVSRIMGKYNPQDSRHDPKDPSTWKINSFRNVTVNFYDGDGNRINGYYAVQEIMSMASVYAYYHDMDDAEAMEEYCRALFKNAMSSRVSMGNVYYDSGCLNRTKQDEAAEAIAMEAQQLATEHQLAGATAISSGLQNLTGAAQAVLSGGVISTDGSVTTITAEDGTVLTQTLPDGSQTAAAEAQTGVDAALQAAGTVVSAAEDVVVSQAIESTTAAVSESYAVVSSGSVSGSEDTEKPSYAVYNGDGLGGTPYSEIFSTQDAASDEVVSAGDGTAETEWSSDDTVDAVEAAPADTVTDTASGTSEDVTSGISSAPVDDPYAGEDIVVSPATGIMNLRRINRLLRRPLMRTASVGVPAPVFRAADEDMVVSPATSIVSEPADPVIETAAPAAEPVPEDVVPVEAGSVSDIPSEAVQEEAADTSGQQETAAETSVSKTAADSGQTDNTEEIVSSGSNNTGSSVTNNYGYAVVGSNGVSYSTGTGSVTSTGTGDTVSQTEETQPQEVLTEEELAVAAQINELLAQANVLSGADSYCPGHIDLYITITIKGIDDRNGLFKADKIGNDKANFNDRWQGWTTDKIAEARALNHQDWFETYGLSISSINLTSQLTEEEIQEYLNTLPADVSETRKAVVDFALHSVGKVPYYWGGKPNGPGYDANHFYTLVGADYHGRILRGLDCSGWVNWVYWSATGSSLAGESTGSLIGCGKRISRSALKPGDIIIRTGADSHVVMFLGWVGNGNFIGIHETGGVKNNVVVGEMTASWPYYRSLLD